MLDLPILFYQSKPYGFLLYRFWKLYRFHNFHVDCTKLWFLKDFCLLLVGRVTWFRFIFIFFVRNGTHHFSRIATGLFISPDFSTRPSHTTFANVPFSHVFPFHQIPDLCVTMLIVSPSYPRVFTTETTPDLQIRFYPFPLNSPFFYRRFLTPVIIVIFLFKGVFFCKMYIGFFSLYVLISLVISFSSAIVSVVRVTEDASIFKRVSRIIKSEKTANVRWSKTRFTHVTKYRRRVMDTWFRALFICTRNTTRFQWNRNPRPSDNNDNSR